LSGLVVSAVAQVAAPLASAPLYDGVVVQDPYRYLAPGANQAGSPTAATSSVPVQGTTSPPFAVATTESPPQAQLIAGPGAFVIPAGTTSLTVAITPVAAAVPPSIGAITGNAYRVSAVDQDGAALRITGGTLPTVVLRAPIGIVEATIAHLDGTTWQELPTQPAGQPGIFVTIVDTLGDFALVLKPAGGPFGLDPTLLIGGIAVLSVLVLLESTRRLRRQTIRKPSARRTPSPSRRPRDGGRRNNPR
jgi:hypothetical protein